MRLRSFQPREMSGNNIEDVISAPLTAAAHANTMMQREQTKFLLETAFKEVNGFHEPIMIEMQLIQNHLDQSNPDSPEMKRIVSVFSIPLLTLLPFNSLAVDEVNVQFEMEITNQFEKDQSYGLMSSKPGEAEKPKTQLKGRVSYDSKEKVDGKSNSRRQNSSSLKVDIHAATLPLPVGVTTILDLYSKSIHPYELDKREEDSSSQSNT